MHATVPRTARLGVLLVAVTAGTTLAVLLWRLTHVGVPFSFDPMLYARSLWGLGYGAPVNPVVGVHAMSVHAHLHQYVLAPLTAVVPAVDVLLVTQVAAFATVLVLAGRAVARSVPAQFATTAAVTTTAALAFGSPWVCNPLLFDVRPDHAAVAFAVAGLLRLRANRRLDGWALALLAAAAACREEMAFALAPAVILAPGLRGDLRARIAGAVALAGWWLAYWFWLRGWFGGDLATARLDGHEQVLLGEGSWFAVAWQQRWARMELVTTLALTGGGLALLAPRWLLAAMPAAAFALVQNRMGEQMLQLHYTMFAAPIVVVAAVEGAARAWHLAGSARWRRGLVVAVLSCSGVLALTSTSWPWGARFDDAAFAMDGDAATHRAHAETRAVLAALPDDAALVVPYAWGADVADRATIYREVPFALAVRDGALSPGDADFIVVSAAHFDDYGRQYAQRVQLPLVARTPLAAVFATDERPVADGVLATVAAPDCTTPVATLEAVGWRVCDPMLGPTGVRVTVERTESRPMPPALWMTDAGPAELGRGLVALSRVPPGRPMHVHIPDGATRLWLMAADGSTVPAQGPGVDADGFVRVGP